MSSRQMGAALALVMLSACETVHPVSQSTDPGLGEAVKYDMAIQVIDPDPVYTAEDARPGDHGQKASEATKRYRTGQVKAVESQGTTAGGSGGGSGPR